MKVMIIGLKNSSHSLSWHSMCLAKGLNATFYPLPDHEGLPYFFLPCSSQFALTHKRNSDIISTQTVRKLYELLLRRIYGHSPGELALIRSVHKTNPHIVHTCGIEPAGIFYFRCLKHLKHTQRPKWFLQVRGGSDVAFLNYDQDLKQMALEVLNACDRVITDNKHTMTVLLDMGIPATRFISTCPIPGSGGIDLAAKNTARINQVKQKIIVWPKAYDCLWSKSLPVIEAFKLLSRRLKGYTIKVFATDDETHIHLKALTESHQLDIQSHTRIDHEVYLNHLTKAMCMVSPSLVDGIPNTLYEAMAFRTIPIVSPLPSIRTIVDKHNVLFARNLYPNEIADALDTALSSPNQTEKMVNNNATIVKKYANREHIAEVIYKEYCSAVDSNAQA